MTSACITTGVLFVIFALVAALTWLSYKYGKTSLLQKQAEKTVKIKQESDDVMAKIKTLSDAELDSELSDCMRND